MLRTLAAEAARRFGQRVAFASVWPPEGARPRPDEPAGEAGAEPGWPGTWQLSYTGLDRLSDEAAAGLAFRGVLPGDMVAIVLPTAPEFPVCVLAAAKIGAIAAGLDPRWPSTVLDRLIDLLRPAVTVAPFGLNIGPGPDGELVRITPARDAGGVLAGFRRAELPPPPLPPDLVRPTMIAFNSARSHGAVFGNGQLDAIRAAEAGDRWGRDVASAVLTAVPFAHYTQMTRLPAVLQSGRACFLMGSRWPGQVARIAAAVRADRFVGLPSQVADLLEQEDPATDLPLLELAVTGDAAPPEGLVPALRRRFGNGVEVTYGCAEAGLGLRTCVNDEAGYADGCVGRPAPGVTLALRDRRGYEVPHGETGEVLMRSAACMTGYWNDPQASVAAFTSDRFVRTGDLGWLDEDGRLVLAGRVGG